MADMAEFDLELKQAPPVERERFERRLVRPRVTRKPKPAPEPDYDEAAEKALCQHMMEHGLVYG